MVIFYIKKAALVNKKVVSPRYPNNVLPHDYGLPYSDIDRLPGVKYLGLIHRRVGSKTLVELLQEKGKPELNRIIDRLFDEAIKDYIKDFYNTQNISSLNINQYNKLLDKLRPTYPGPKDPRVYESYWDIEQVSIEKHIYRKIDEFLVDPEKFVKREECPLFFKLIELISNDCFFFRYLEKRFTWYEPRKETYYYGKHRLLIDDIDMRKWVGHARYQKMYWKDSIREDFEFLIKNKLNSFSSKNQMAELLSNYIQERTRELYEEIPFKEKEINPLEIDCLDSWNLSFSYLKFNRISKDFYFIETKIINPIKDTIYHIIYSINHYIIPFVKNSKYTHLITNDLKNIYNSMFIQKFIKPLENIYNSSLIKNIKIFFIEIIKTIKTFFIEVIKTIETFFIEVIKTLLEPIDNYIGDYIHFFGSLGSFFSLIIIVFFHFRERKIKVEYEKDYQKKKQAYEKDERKKQAKDNIKKAKE